MIEIIRLMNAVIDTCQNCTGASTCPWLRQMREAGNEMKQAPESTHDFTWDELAGVTYSDVTISNCLEQYSYDALMKRVEDILMETPIPASGKKLSIFIQQLLRVEKRLNRLPYEVMDAFDAEIYAVSERVLSAIDFYYLNNGVDISDVIARLYPHYRHKEVLEDYNSPAIVSLLQKKATIIKFEDVINSEQSILEFARTQQEQSANQTQASSSKKGGKPVTGNGKFIEVIERPTYSPLQTITDLLSNQSTCDYVAAIIMSLGFRPANYHQPYEYYVEHNFIAKSLENHLTFAFADYRGLYQELYSEIEKRRADEHALSLYMSDILAPFQVIAPLVYPVPRDIESGLLSVAMGRSYQYRDYSLKMFSNAVKSAYDIVMSNKYPEPNDYITHFCELLDNDYYNDKECSSEGVLDNFNSIVDIFRLLQLTIESALLLNGTPHDHLYYEEQNRVSLGLGVQDMLIARFTDKAPAFIRQLAGKYGHRVAGGVRPDDDLDSYYERLIANPHDTIFTGYSFMKPSDEVDNDKGESNAPVSQSKQNVVSEGDSKTVSADSSNISVNKEGADCKIKLPARLSTPEAMAIWNKAKLKGVVDDNYEFYGSLTELTVFAGYFSYALFHKHDWKLFEQWHYYHNYAKTYCEFMNKDSKRLSTEIQTIISIFE